MKAIGFLMAIFLAGSASAKSFDAKAIYEALHTQAVSGVEPDSKYHYWLKSVPGFVTCKKWDFKWDAYNCYFGGIDGYSMSDQAYQYLDVPEELISDPDAGGSKTFRKSVGGLTCTHTVFAHPRREGDMTFHGRSNCEIKLKFSGRN